MDEFLSKVIAEIKKTYGDKDPSLRSDNREFLLIGIKQSYNKSYSVSDAASMEYWTSDHHSEKDAIQAQKRLSVKYE